MKILWIDLNSSYAHSSLALPALHAQIMTDPSIEWEIVSATINENAGMIVDEIYHHQPDILAATTWLFNHEQLIHVASRVKALLPKTCLVLGGPEFLGDNEEFLRKNPFVDCVFRGEGEEVFPQWLTCWNHPEQWHTVPGLCYLTPYKEYKDNGIARVLNFAGLVPPEQSRFFNWSKPFVQLETTRGCFNTCAFCVSGGEKPVRTLSIESIRRRLQLIHAHGIKNVRVLDRTFNYNPRRAKELLRLFLEFHPDIRFHLEIHPALLSEELPENVQSHYHELCVADHYPACYPILASLPKLTIHSWLTALQTERLEQKAQLIMQRLELCNNNWEDAFFITLARNFGFGLNGDTFETWAGLLPFRALGKHRNDLFQIEAFFYGLAV